LSSLDRVGTGFILTASIATASGERTAIFQRQVANEDALLFALDTLSLELRAEIGDTRRQLRESPSLLYLLTPSVEAMRKFAEARAAIPDYGRAQALLTEAVTIDSTFAWAWAYLALLRQNVGGDYLAAAERAWALVDRMAPFQRAHWELAWLGLGLRDFQGVRETAQRLLASPPPDARFDPDFPQMFYTDLSLARLESGEPEAALEGYAEWRRLVADESEVDPDPDAAMINLAMVHYRLGNIEAAQRELESFADFHDAGVLPVHAYAPAAAAAYDTATAILEAALDLTTHPWWSPMASELLGTLEAVRGRPSSSRTYFARAFEFAEPNGMSLSLQQADAEFFALEDPQRAAASLLRVLSGEPPDSGLARRAYARAQGLMAAICAHLAELPVEGPASQLDCAAPIVTDSLHDTLETLEALGWRAVAEGRLDDAVEIGREPLLLRAGGQGLRARASAAYAFVVLDMPDSAKAIYEPMAEAPFGWVANAPSAIVMRSYALRRLSRMEGAVADSAGHILRRDWSDAEPAFLQRMMVP
jgi:tetratricopeptide (TPR) repeat protein